MSTTRKTQPDPQKSAAKSTGEKPSRLRRWVWFGVRCGLYYCGTVLVIAYFQRSLMYPATRVEKLTIQAAGLAIGRVHDLSLQSADGLTLHGWHILPRGQTAVDEAGCDALLQEGGPVVLFFSGNGGNRQHRIEEYEILSSLKNHVVVFDYRGYGENPGAPSEKKIAEDAWAAWKYLSVDRKVSPSRIILYGESLGGGVATRLAAEACDAETPPRGLILRSTFSSMVDAASHKFPWLPVRLVLVDRYLSISRIPRVTCPILMLHVVLDRIVPFRLGQKLFEAAPESSAAGIQKQFVEIPKADHNDVLLVAEQLYRDSISEFLKRVEADK